MTTNHYRVTLTDSDLSSTQVYTGRASTAQEAEQLALACLPQAFLTEHIKAHVTTITQAEYEQGEPQRWTGPRAV